MSEKQFVMGGWRTFKTGIILQTQRELSTDEVYEVLMEYEKEIKELKKENKELKKHEELFFKQVFDILLKYQDLFNREMADEVLEELGIELTRWFE